MTACAFVIPGDIGMLTGGYAYDRRVLALLPAHGIAVRHVALPGSYPEPTEFDLQETARVLAALPADIVLLMDGLAYGAMPAETIARLQQRIVALVHHPLALEAGLTQTRVQSLQQCEQTALGLAKEVIATSAMTARILERDFDVPMGKIAIAEPGTDRVARARGTGTPVQLLAVGSIVPRKGYDTLALALHHLERAPDWHLTIVGAVRDETARAALDQHLAAPEDMTGLPLGRRVTITGAVSDARLFELYDRADVFVMPSLYEGYGMVLAEALVRGLPIVCTTGVAAAHALPTGTVVMIEPGDATALGSRLNDLVLSAPLRRRYADAAWSAGQVLPTWDDTARTIATVLKKVAA